MMVTDSGSGDYSGGDDHGGGRVDGGGSHGGGGSSGGYSGDNIVPLLSFYRKTDIALVLKVVHSP